MGVVLDAPRKRLFLSTGRGGTVAVVSLEGTAEVGDGNPGRRASVGYRPVP